MTPGLECPTDPGLPTTSKEGLMTHRMFARFSGNGTQARRLAAQLMLGLLVLALPLLLVGPAVAKVGHNSCVGPSACLDNTATVKNNSCDGDGACVRNTGASIGNDSCNGVQACINNSGTVGNNSCDGFQACVLNTGASIGNGSCDGDRTCILNSG